MSLRQNFSPFALLLLALAGSGQAASPRPIRVAAYELMPYVGVNNEDSGFIRDLALRALRDAGYQPEIKFYPPLRAKVLIDSGQVDALLPTYADPIEGRKLIFSMPLYRSDLVVLRRHFLLPKTRTDRASQTAENLMNRIDPSRILASSSDKVLQTINMISQGRLVTGIADRLVAAETLGTRRPDLIGEVEIVNPPVRSPSLHLAFRATPEGERIAAAFNRAFQNLIDQGVYQKSLARYGYQSHTAQQKELIVATIPNADLERLAQLSHRFVRKWPKTKVTFITLEENILFRRLLASIALREKFFDVYLLGLSDVKVYQERGWLAPLANLTPSYDEADLFPALREQSRVNGVYYSLPFYNEVSMTYYRRDIFQKHGLKMPKQPSYADILAFAQKIHEPKNKFYGICMRGKEGWGENMIFITTMLHSFGGRWFSNTWEPLLDTPVWHRTVSLYMQLAKNYGPPEVYLNGYLENLKIFAQGHCGIWIDASVAASALADPNFSRVAGNVGYSEAPTNGSQVGRSWRWTWALAVAASSDKKALAQAFVEWATSKEYIEEVAKNYGWLQVPPGTRRSTYASAGYQEAADFVKYVGHEFEEPVNRFQFPYSLGSQAMGTPDLPQGMALGDAVGALVAAVLKNEMSLEQALQRAKLEAKWIMYYAGYYEGTDLKTLRKGPDAQP